MITMFGNQPMDMFAGKAGVFIFLSGGAGSISPAVGSVTGFGWPFLNFSSSAAIIAAQV